MGSSPNLVQGQQPNPSQWNSYFVEKADDVVFTGDAGLGGVEGLVPPPPPGTGALGYVLGANGRWIPQTGGGGGSGVLIQTITYNSPSTGNTITMTVPLTNLIVLQITPASELASLSIVLPPSSPDGQIVEVATTETIDDLTVSGGSSAVFGGLNNILMANGGASWRYRLSNNTWYRRY